jgi:hypothetical protein
MDTDEILDDIYWSTANAFTDGYDTEKILLTQEVYDVFKKENEEILGVGNGDFDKLLVYPVEINNEIDSYMVVIKEIC